MTELNDFKVEELEQRLEMSGWSAETGQTQSPEGPGLPDETSYYIVYRGEF